jgi:hypothetical protein
MVITSVLLTNRVHFTSLSYLQQLLPACTPLSFLKDTIRCSRVYVMKVAPRPFVLGNPLDTQLKLLSL